jgi:hypothetical protein
MLNFLKSYIGRIIISIIWGFGLATLFRKSCKGKRCIILKAPLPDEIKKNIYKFNKKCYKFTPNNIKCL